MPKTRASPATSRRLKNSDLPSESRDIVRRYLSEAGRIKLLSAHKELELGRELVAIENEILKLIFLLPSFGEILDSVIKDIQKHPKEIEEDEDPDEEEIKDSEVVLEK